MELDLAFIEKWKGSDRDETSSGVKVEPREEDAGLGSRRVRSFVGSSFVGSRDAYLLSCHLGSPFFSDEESLS